MRVADKMLYNQANNGIGKNRTEMTGLQEQVSSMKRVSKPSDDPVAAAKVLGARTEIANYDQFLKNVNVARSFLDFSDQSLGELSETLLRAKEIALSQANDAGANAVSRRTTALEVEQLHDQAVQIGNRKLGERYLFGGFKTTRPPFTKDGEYKGDDGEMIVQFSKGSTVALNVPGNRIFLGDAVKGTESPQNTEELRDLTPEQREMTPPPTLEQQSIPIRGPASIDGYQRERLPTEDNEPKPASGENVFRVLKDLSIGLKANDTKAIQDTLDRIDTAYDQIVLSRALVGSRSKSLNTAEESLQKGTVDLKSLASSYEDADVYQLFSDLTKSENTLKATLSSSGKMVQLSLLDFLR